MVSRLGLIIAGLFCLFSGYRLFVVPLSPDAPELKGWLFRQYGQQGVAVGTAVLGALMVTIGVIVFTRAFRRVLRQRARARMSLSR